MPDRPTLSTAQVIARVAVAIFGAGLLVVLIAPRLIPFKVAFENSTIVMLKDIVLLGLVATPIVYFWVIRALVQSRDQALAEVARLTVTDAVTQLANQIECDRVLAREHARHARSGLELSLIVLDVDAVNSGQWSLVDRLLRPLAKVMSACVARPCDLVARYGEQTFACILPETDGKAALAIAERIRADISALTLAEAGTTKGVQIHLGLAVMRCGDENSADMLLAQAHRQLLTAKTRGDGRVAFDAHQMSLHNDRHFIKLVWKPGFCSGNRLIDSQHRRLFLAANHVLDAILLSHTTEDVLAQVAVLIEEARQHFRDEIRILETLGCPGTKQHGAEHEALIGKALHLARDFQGGWVSVAELFEFLAEDMIARHILGSDREYFYLTQDPAAAHVA